MATDIKHEGRVVSVSDGHALVQIVQSSACQACQAKSMCHSSESKTQQVDARCLMPVSVGDMVEVVISERLAWRAVLLAYMLPTVLMVVLMMVLNSVTGWDDAIVGTVALVALATYYLVLGAFRDKLQHQFEVYVVGISLNQADNKKTNQQ